MHDRDASGAVMIDIDAELSCWQEMEGGATSDLVFLFHEWEPAIRVGIHAYLAYPERDFDSIRPDMLEVYERIRGRSRIPWDRAAPAARRVWRKLQRDSEQHDGADPQACAAAWQRRVLPQVTEMPLAEA
jgi:hypothetical protein